MNFGTKFLRFFFPKPWAQTLPPTPAERRAQWRIRQGFHLAHAELKADRLAQAFDVRTAEVQAVKPKLPADRVVVPFKRKSA